MNPTTTPTTPTAAPAGSAMSSAVGAVGPAVPVSDPVVESAWAALSVALTDEAPTIADREDLLVSIAPGAGQGSPACFLPALARIEVDGTHLEIDPGEARPWLGAGDRTRYGTAWGLFTHECAHARHSTWQAPPDAPPGVVAAATLLEEARIEAAQIRRRPDDRHWLRASSTNLILTDLVPTPSATTPEPAATSGAPAVSAATPVPTTPSANPTPTVTAPVEVSLGGRAQAAHAAALVLARVDAGILTDIEVAPVARAVEAVLGAEGLARLQTLWRAALAVDDHDTTTMIDLGRRWCAEVGTDPATPTPAPHAPTAPHGPTGPGAPTPGSVGARHPGPNSPDASAPAPGGGDGVIEAVRSVCREVELGVLIEAPLAAPDPAQVSAAQQRAENTARTRAESTATWLLDDGAIVLDATRTGATATTGDRPPTAAEQAAARVLGRALNTAGIRDRVATRTTSVLPPGRLRMRGALAADAQRAAGAMPTAEPFTRTTRRPVETPPLRVGVACDVSGSMREFAGPVASTAWILAHAARHALVPVTTASVIFGVNVRVLTRPGHSPRAVTEFACGDGWERPDIAVDALDGALNLSTPGAARLLVVVSDGRFRSRHRGAAQRRVDRLITSGCAVLWLTPPTKASEPLDGATVHPLTDPTATAAAIGRATTSAVRAQRP